MNGSYEDIEVLVRSKVDILLKDHWARAEGYQEGDIVTGKVSILRDRLDVSVEGETVIFTFQYWNGTGYVTNNVCLLYTSPSPRDRQKSRMPSSA